MANIYAIETDMQNALASYSLVWLEIKYGDS